MSSAIGMRKVAPRRAARHLVSGFAGAAVVIAAVVILAGCGSAEPAPTTSADLGAAPSGTASLDTVGQTRTADTVTVTSGAVADEVAAGLVALAVDPSTRTVSALPFAERVRLGLGPTLLTTVARARLDDADAWRVEPREGYFRASVGPFSALETVSRHVAASGRDQEDAVAVSEGEHPDCFGRPAPAPAGLDSARRIAVRPADGTIDSCIQWFSVDAFIQAGEIVAVTLDIGEP